VEPELRAELDKIGPDLDAPVYTDYNGLKDQAGQFLEDMNSHLRYRVERAETQRDALLVALRETVGEGHPYQCDRWTGRADGDDYDDTTPCTCGLDEVLRMCGGGA
jgi:hypothetical protein